MVREPVLDSSMVGTLVSSAAEAATGKDRSSVRARNRERIFVMLFIEQFPFLNIILRLDFEF